MTPTSSRSLRSLTLAAALGAGLLGCAATLTPWPGPLERWGSVREAMGQGRSEARVELAQANRPGRYGVGALEGLAGEVTVFDGQVWATRGDPLEPLTSVDPDEGSATLLVLAEVPAWREQVVPRPVTADELPEWLADQARAAGLDPEQPFPFVVRGGLADLTLHVVDGQCPRHAAMTGTDLEHPPYRWTGDHPSGRLVGFHAPGATGVLVHHGSALHVHAILDEQPRLTGHVESVALATGAILALPDTGD